MKVWTNNKFDGHYPVGTAAVVVADTAEQAAKLLNDALEAVGLHRSTEAAEFVAMPTWRPGVRILCDGNY